MRIGFPWQWGNPDLNSSSSSLRQCWIEFAYLSCEVRDLLLTCTVVVDTSKWRLLSGATFDWKSCHRLCCDIYNSNLLIQRSQMKVLSLKHKRDFFCCSLCIDWYFGYYFHPNNTNAWETGTSIIHVDAFAILLSIYSCWSSTFIHMSIKCTSVYSLC